MTEFLEMDPLALAIGLAIGLIAAAVASDAHHRLAVIDTRIQDLLRSTRMNIVTLPHDTQQIPQSAPVRLSAT